MSEHIVAVVTAQLEELIDPVTAQSFLANKALRSVDVSPESVTVNLRKGYPLAGVHQQLAELVKESLADLPYEARDLQVEFEQHIVSHAVQQGIQAVDGIKNIIAVASGKGGVGKSTVSANLALALAHAGAEVAVLDADIYGPSQPRMLGAAGKPETLDNKQLIPLCSHDIRIMSIGFLVAEDTPMIWRGPMVTQALEQLLRGTTWQQQNQAEVDYLIVDLPPGTGDIQLTLSQKVPLTGAVIVTTPQDIALLDARKAYKMFEKVEVPILGIVENMSTYVCSQCGHEESIFGRGGGNKMAADYGLDVLGAIPLQKSIRELADSGNPSVAADPNSEISQRYAEIAMRVAGKLAARKRDFSSSFPNIVVERS